MKQKVLRKSVKAFAMALGMTMVLGLTGCGEAAPGTVEGQSVETSASAESTGAQTGSAESGTAATIDSRLQGLLGQWQTFADCYEDGDIWMSEDYGGSTEVVFFEEDGKVKADYSSFDEGSVEIYGATLTVVNEKIKPGSKTDWYAEFGRREKEGSVRYYKVSLEDGLIHVVSHNEYTYDDYDTGKPEVNVYEWESIGIQAENPQYEALLDSFRYTETVTVSNVKELYNAIGSKKHIILKAGTYNISSLSEADRMNENINQRGYYDDENYEYVTYNVTEDTIYMDNIYYLFLEGEEGAEVSICTNDPYVAPLEFGSASHVVLKNLTVGHNVERGQCTGSVICLSDSRFVTIDNCKLYGCGTYGVEAYSTGNLNVKNSDIYECSYGLVYLNNCYESTIEDCTMRDSNGYCMLELPGSWGMTFRNCTISNNVCDGFFSFIEASTPSVTFENCTFTNNSYSSLKKGDVSMKGCVINDK